MTPDGEAGREPVLDELVFRRAADSSVDGVAIVGLDRRILYINEARARMHGCTPAELIGKDVSMLSASPGRPGTLPGMFSSKGCGRESKMAAAETAPCSP